MAPPPSIIPRSEEMCLAQLFLQNEAAYACVAELGELGLVQFRDLNPSVSAFHRKYVKEVRRCDEMERKLRYLEREIKRDAIEMYDTGESPEAPQPREMFDLEATFEKLENEMREVNQNEEMLKKNFAELTELKHILRKTQQFFEEHEGERQALDQLTQEDGSPLAGNDDARLIQERDLQHAKSQLKFVAGVIQRERIPAFERLLWRACRGNVFLRQSEITEALSDTVTGDSVSKAVFIIFFQGDQLKTKVKKICEGFRATIYPCPDTPQERREMSIGVMTRIEDLKTVLSQTQDHRHRVLRAAAKNVRVWMAKVRKIKAIYHTLNLFNLDVTQKCLIAECWCPVADLSRIQDALKLGSENSGSTVPSILNRMETPEAPPTFNRSNKYTQGFQNIIDAYGIATYREINPVPYTMITFPFLFAVMFGDLGHGIIMLAAALFLVLCEKRLEAARITDEIFQMFFTGRYVILLMGLFSIYTGFIYNDVFSKSMNLFGSQWMNIYSTDFLRHKKLEDSLMLDPKIALDAGGPYPMGVDPVWNLAELNKLNFLNSMKMKASVVIGICQMSFGVVLSYYNFQYFKSRLDTLFVFVPQMIFLGCIFMYLCLQIVVKWIAYDAAGGYYILGYYYPDAQCAPSLLIGLINMFMMKDRDRGFVEGNERGGPNLPQCHLNYWYPGQPFFERLFLLTAIACVFVMLLVKPYKLWQAQKQRAQSGHSQLVTEVLFTPPLQGAAERVLLLISLMTLPVMLFAKPLLQWSSERREKRRAAGWTRLRSDTHDPRDPAANAFGGGGANSGPVSVRADVASDDAEVIHHPPPANNHAKSEGGGHGDDEPFDLGNIMVYQAIHTIEFALGCISHTASYLRLWALSLAHAQLSDVLWTMVFRSGLAQGGYGGPIATYLIFFVFATLTLFILVLMEGLSAFLHALRLHWVEFCGKFFEGRGHAFNPFSFSAIIEEARATDDAQ